LTTAASPGHVSALILAPNKVKSSEATTASVAGSGHCKFSVDNGNGSILSQEADLPAKLPLSFIVASYETRVFTVKVSGLDGCKGTASADITVGEPVPYGGGPAIKPSQKLLVPADQLTPARPNP
jgi:hypothetical protein